MRSLAPVAAPAPQVVAPPAPMSPSQVPAPPRGERPGLEMERARPGRADDRSRIAYMRQMQRSHGNRAVQQMMAQRVRTPPAEAGVQRDAKDDAPWWKVAAFGETVAWKMMGEFAPQLVPIVQGGTDGMAAWLKTRATSAAGVAFDGLLNPVRAVAGAGASMSAQFTPLVATLQDAGAKIAANDCSPISQAVDKIEATAEKILMPIVATLQPVVAKIEGFFSAVWDRIGAPIWDWIKQYAADQWNMVKQVAGWIWSFTQPMRTLGQEAWTWVKNLIGIGEGVEGENGVLQWLQAKFEAVWSEVKTALEPFTKQLGVIKAAATEVGQALMAPISQVGSLVSSVGKGVAWLGSHLTQGNLLVEARAYVEKSLLPPLIGGVRQLGTAMTGVATGIAASLGKVAAGLDAAAATIANPLLHFAASAVQWIAGEVNALAAWATQKLGGVATWLQSALGKLDTFLHGLMEFLQKLGRAAADVWSLPVFLAEKVWNWIPACIRDPVVDFLVPIILRQVELFEELVRDNEAWQKTKVQVMALVRKVFVDHDLVGAVKGAFGLVLRALNIPPEMLSKVAAKAMAAWDVVSKKPIDFIKNTVRSLGQGFQLLWTNLGTHLEHGMQGWLLGEIGDKEIQLPKDWTSPRDLFGFVTDVMGLTSAHIVELFKQRIDPKLVDKVQAWVGRFGRAWDWVTNAIDTSKSPAQNAQGLVLQAKDFGKTIITGAVEWVTGKVATELATLAAAAAASGGLSEVLDIARRIYKAMVTAKRWAGQILQMADDALDHVLDIAGGNISKVGGEFEKLMDKGMPVVIGFLADQVGLSGVGSAVRNIVDKLRAQVDAAILWLIDKVKAGIEAVVGGIKSGVAAVADWLGLTKRFTAFGESHRVYFTGTTEAAKVVVASVETDVATVLAPGGKLEQDIAESKDAAREQALPLARHALEVMRGVMKKVAAQSTDQVALGELRAAMDDLAARLQQTGVEPLIPVFEGRKLVEGLTVMASSGKQPLPVKISAIDVKDRRFHYVPVQGSGVQGYFGFDGYRRAWWFLESPNDIVEQIHHLIPWKTERSFNHARHPLRELSQTDLRTDSRNLEKVIGHQGPHAASYHQEVVFRMNRALDDLKKAGKATQPEAFDKIGSVMRGIYQSISDQSLPLYPDRTVATRDTK